MRIYVPQTTAVLTDDFCRAGRLDLRVGDQVYAAPDQPGLSADDIEEWEFAAMVTASAHSAVRSREQGATVLRLVLSVDVPDSAVKLEGVGPEAVIGVDLDGVAVVCAHVDEPAASAAVSAALQGGAPDLDALAEVDLLWYDATELAQIPRP